MRLRRRAFLRSMFGMGILLAGSAACGGSSGSAKSPLTYAEIQPFTGPISGVINGMVKGADVATKVINASGGVSGHPLEAAAEDTTGDIADAVTAFRSLQLKHPVFELGPTSLEINGVIGLYGPAHLPDFTSGSQPALATSYYKYVYRILPDDALLAKGMAVYAVARGYTRAAVMFINDTNAQALVPALTTAYKAHGGTITSNIALSPGQTSYATEVEQVFAVHPQAIFMHLDAQTAGTLVQNLQSLGDLKVPLIFTDTGTDPQVLSAIGKSVAEHWVTAMQSSPVTGPAYRTFVHYWSLYEGSSSPAEFADTQYDSVNIAALAMTAAHSVDRVKWIGFVRQVTAESGTECSSYVQCATFLKKGERIDYEGASGPMDFDRYNGVVTPFDVAQPQADGSFKIVYHESASMLLSSQ